MRVALHTTFAASKKEPLAAMLDRVHEAFVSAGFGAPSVRFWLTDHAAIALPAELAGLAGMRRVSSIDRVVKRFPALERFKRQGAMSTGSPAGSTRALSNVMGSDTVEPVDFATLREIAAGVPKSFPFHKALFHFSAPGFSEGPSMPASPGAATLSMLMRAGVDIGAGHPTSPGISVQDAWWVNGRQRSMAALRIIEADPGAKKLPVPPPAVASVLAACGKVRKTTQLPVIVEAPAAEAGSGAAEQPKATETLRARETIRAVVRAWRLRMPELLETLPHDLPQREEPAGEPGVLGVVASGPKKPALEEAFGPMGYDCRGGTGTFSLRRRTVGNLTVELALDVGTWSNLLMAFFHVQGLIDGEGFRATLPLPVSRNAARGMVRGVEMVGQFPIGGPERWRKIVDNLGALVRELDRGFVPEVEAAAGPSPQWYRPKEG